MTAFARWLDRMTVDGKRPPRLRVSRSLFAVAGAALVIAGIALVFVPAAVILAGLLLIGLTIEVRP